MMASSGLPRARVSPFPVFFMPHPKHFVTILALGTFLGGPCLAMASEDAPEATQKERPHAHVTPGPFPQLRSRMKARKAIRRGRKESRLRARVGEEPSIQGDANEGAGDEGVWGWVERLEGQEPSSVASSSDPSPTGEGDASGDPKGAAASVGAAAVLAESAFDIPIDRTPEVEKWIQYFTVGGRKHFERWLSRAPRYQPMMRAALREAGLPEDLVFLAMIESGYNDRAYSSAAAAGHWQFISSTGRSYGLRIDWWVDDRRDPEKSLDAAIRYLDELHRMFGDWRLAWASYNTGPGRVKRATVRAGSKDYWVLARGPYLHSETDNYVPKIMAAAIVGKDPAAFGFVVPEGVPALVYDKAQVDGSVDLEVLAQCAGLPVDKLKALNPGLRRFATPPEGYELRIPKGRKAKFQTALAKVPADQRVRVVQHAVRRGETLSMIATSYGVSVDAVVRANQIRNPDRIRVGTSLMIPTRGGSTGPVASTGSSSASVHHTVVAGDTLSGLSTRYGISVERIRSLNGLTGSTIQVGQRLALRGVSSSSVSVREQNYTVRRGDTLGSIADRYGVGVADLQTWNRIANSSHIRVGQVLTIRAQAQQWTPYQVRAGDSLGGIASKKDCSVQELVRWNSLSTTVIHPGQTLRIHAN